MPSGCEGRVCRSSCGLRTVRAELVEILVFWFGRRAGVEGGSRVVAPAGDSLSFASPKESKQRKGAPQSATPALRSGANLRRGYCGGRRGTRFALRAPLGQPRRVRARSMRAPTRMLTPQPPRRRRRQQGVDSRTSNSRTATRAFASLGPLSRAQAPRAAQAGPSAAMARVDVRFAGPLLYAPGARSEFCGAPRDRAPQVAPQRSEGVADSRVAFSLVTFFWRSKRKPLRRRAHTPAPALNPSTPSKPERQAFDNPSSNRRMKS